MNRSPIKRLVMLWYCLGAVVLYALTPALLLFEWLYAGGPRGAGGALLSRGRPFVIAAFLALVIYDLTRALIRRHG